MLGCEAGVGEDRRQLGERLMFDQRRRLGGEESCIKEETLVVGVRDFEGRGQTIKHRAADPPLTHLDAGDGARVDASAQGDLILGEPALVAERRQTATKLGIDRRTAHS